MGRGGEVGGGAGSGGAPGTSRCHGVRRRYEVPVGQTHRYLVAPHSVESNSGRGGRFFVGNDGGVPGATLRATRIHATRTRGLSPRVAADPGQHGGVPAGATLRATRIDATRTRGPLRVAADPLRATTAACQGQRCAPPKSSQPRVPRPPKRAAEGGALHHSWSCGVIGAANAAACRINAARQPLGSSTAHGRSRHVLLQPVCGPGG